MCGRRALPFAEVMAGARLFSACSSPSLPFLPRIYVGIPFNMPLFKTQHSCILFCKHQLRPGKPEIKATQLSVVGPEDTNMLAYRALKVAFALPPPTYFFQLTECHLCLCMEQVSLVNSLNKLNFKKRYWCQFTQVQTSFRRMLFAHKHTTVYCLCCNQSSARRALKQDGAQFALLLLLPPIDVNFMKVPSRWAESPFCSMKN